MNCFPRKVYVCIAIFIGVINSLYAQKYNLAICAIFRNEAFFLKEWIEFHKLMGAEHFYLYNNLSSDEYFEILKPYTEAGEIDLFDWPVETNNQKEYYEKLQVPAYNHALQIVKETAKWAAFIDLDEFLYPVKKNSLIDFLADFEEFGGVAVNWQMYGTSWMDYVPPEKYLIESLILKAPENVEMNKLIKHIVQPGRVNYISNTHCIDYKEGFFAVDSNKRPLENNLEWQPVVVDGIRINHYWFGTYNWFIHEKLPRRTLWGFKMHKDALSELIRLCNAVEDCSIKRFIPEFKKRMKEKE